MQIRKGLLTFLFITFLLSGCHKISGQEKYQALLQRENLKVANSNLQAIKMIAPLSIESGEEKEFEINSNDPVIVLNGCYNNYKLFKVPNNKSGKITVTVKSYCDCGGFTKQILFPIAYIVDDNGDMVEKGFIDVYYMEQATFLQPFRLEGKKTLNLTSGKNYFLIVSANNLQPDESLGYAKMASTTTATEAFKLTIDPSGAGISVQNHPTGNLQVKITAD